ncbi:MAG: DUF5682 family protein, partial [Candidatus Hodarchaeales archaeon]
MKNLLPSNQELIEEINQYKIHLKLHQVNKDQWTIFLPIRHHSPSCSIKIKQWILKNKPDAILVEGPASSSHLIELLLHPQVTPPLALYDYLVDKKNQFGLNGINTPSEDIPYRFHSWHPFADYSPEYQALKIGSEVDAYLEFIDLGLEDRLKAIKKAQVEQNAGKEFLDREPWGDYQYLSNQYILKLMAKTGTRDFNELWFSLIEVPGISLSPEKYFLNLHSFALTTRFLSPDTLH